MYKVLIADDEELIRQGFMELVPWAENGFKVVRVCETGNEVIDYLKENKIDFILTDIVMTGKTGLDIAKYVYENTPDTIVCIVSGFKDFEYARTAMQYNVKYYLTKPTDFDRLFELIKEIRNILDERRNNSAAAQNTDMYKDLIFAFILGSPDNLKTISDTLSASFAGMDCNEVRESVAELFELIIHKMKDEDLDSITSIYKHCLTLLEVTQSKEEMIETVCIFLTEISSILNKHMSPSEIIINKAKKYISEHYSDSISLDDVANYVFLNPSYFSRLFKQHTGMNFRDYLINVRINEAISMINEGKYKIYQISEMCGYSNPKYFALQFKQITGMSPKEYLNKANKP